MADFVAATPTFQYFNHPFQLRAVCSQRIMFNTALDSLRLLLHNLQMDAHPFRRVFIQQRDVDLFQLFRTVIQLRGYDALDNSGRWHQVAEYMGYPEDPQGQQLRQFYIDELLIHMEHVYYMRARSFTIMLPGSYYDSIVPIVPIGIGKADFPQMEDFWDGNLEL